MKYKAKFYGIPCYYIDYSANTGEKYILYGRNEFYDFLVSVMTFLHCGFSFIAEAITGEGLDFPIYIEDDNDI